MITRIDPSRVLVISVGLETYDYGAGMHLPGAAAQAERFARWALGCGVPPQRVWLACSPPAAIAPPPDGVVLAGTKYAELQDVFVKSSECNGDLLLVFWCGHGVLNEKRERALFTSDAYAKIKRNLVLDDVLDYFSSDAVSSFGQQILFIDACANFVQDMHLGETLTRGSMPVGQPREVQQFILYSAAQGQIADYNIVERQPTFSKTVLGWLEDHTPNELPPDVRQLTKYVDDVFERLADEGKLRQTPVTRIVRYYQGSDDVANFGGGMPVTGTTQLAVRSSGVTVLQMQRVANAIASLSPLTQPGVRSELVHTLIGDTDPGTVADLGLQDLVARILAEGKTELLFKKLEGYATTTPEQIAVRDIRTVWERQKLIAPALQAFSTATSQQMRDAFYWAVPDLDDGMPSDLDDAMDRAASYGVRNNGQLAVHRLVASLEHATQVKVRDDWFGLSADRLNALRTEAAMVSRDTARLVVDLSSGSFDPTVFSWPTEIVGHEYIPGMGWISPQVIESGATLEGVQAAVTKLLLEMAKRRIASYTLGFIAPRAAFDEIPELWWSLGSPLTKPIPLWRDRPTVLHSAERRTDWNALAIWTERTAAIKSRLVNEAPDVTWIDPSKREDPENIRDAVSRAESPCYGLEFAIGGACDDLQQDPIIATVVGGAPYLLWARREPADWDAAKKRLDKLVTQGPFDELPIRLHRLRVDEKDGLGDIVRLIWDEPGALPPIPELPGFEKRD